MKLLIAALGLLACVPMLASCGHDEHQDLKQWMNDASQDIKGKILPIPEIKPFPIVSYDAGDMIDPFNVNKIEPDKKPSADGGGIKPDFDRFKEPLEAFPLESLKMVGLLKRGVMMHAIIKADQSVHTVKIGNYMGQNFGMIVDITDSEVQLKELVQEPGGEWVERTNALQLQEQEVKK